MVVKIRCTECRQTVPAAPSAKGAQKVCSKACRKKRDRNLARKRRRAELQEYRQDEVRRKRAQRQREREERGQALTAEGESASRQTIGDCHAPGSASNLAEVLDKIDEIVEETFEMSRARLRRELEAMVLKTAAQSTTPPVRAGP